jgi:hypothetical protein
MGQIKSEKGFINMTKKSRFSMLEVEKNDLRDTPKEVPEEIKGIKSPKQFKVVVETDEFRKNLEQHRLTEKIKIIEKQKINIKVDVKRIKQQAYLKILAGALIVFYSLNRYIFPRFMSSKIEMRDNEVVDLRLYKDSQMTSENYIIIGGLVIFFIYLYISDKNKGKK